MAFVAGCTAVIAAAISPNVLTVLGLALSLAAAVATARGLFVTAGVIVLAAGMCDLLDGALARYTRRANSLGALLDSTFDRLSDAALYCGAVLYFASDANLTYVLLGLSGLAVAQAISYVRARAENLVERCRVGTWERPERMALLIAGLVSGHLTTALWILATLPYLTVAARVLHARRLLADASEDGGVALAQPAVGRWAGELLLWGFPRRSVAYWLQMTAIAGFCVLVEIPDNDWLRWVV